MFSVLTKLIVFPVLGHLILRGFEPNDSTRNRSKIEEGDLGSDEQNLGGENETCNPPSIHRTVPVITPYFGQLGGYDTVKVEGLTTQNCVRLYGDEDLVKGSCLEGLVFSRERVPGRGPPILFILKDRRSRKCLTIGHDEDLAQVENETEITLRDCLPNGVNQMFKRGAKHPFMDKYMIQRASNAFNSVAVCLTMPQHSGESLFVSMCRESYLPDNDNQYWNI